MPESSCERHNRLAHEFSTKTIRELVDAGDNFADLMILVETIMVASMMVNAKIFKVSDRACVELLESAVLRATERFIAERSGEF